MSTPTRWIQVKRAVRRTIPLTSSQMTLRLNYATALSAMVTYLHDMWEISRAIRLPEQGTFEKTYNQFNEKLQEDIRGYSDAEIKESFGELNYLFGEGFKTLLGYIRGLRNIPSINEQSTNILTQYGIPDKAKTNTKNIYDGTSWYGQEELERFRMAHPHAYFNTEEGFFARVKQLVQHNSPDIQNALFTLLSTDTDPFTFKYDENDTYTGYLTVHHGKERTDLDKNLPEIHDQIINLRRSFGHFSGLTRKARYKSYAFNVLVYLWLLVQAALLIQLHNTNRRDRKRQTVPKGLYLGAVSAMSFAVVNIIMSLIQLIPGDRLQPVRGFLAGEDLSRTFSVVGLLYVLVLGVWTLVGVQNVKESSDVYGFSGISGIVVPILVALLKWWYGKRKQGKRRATGATFV